MMRVVLDTNVLVSGVFWQGACAKVIDAWVLERFTMIVSSEIFAEFVRVMQDFKKQLSTSDFVMLQRNIVRRADFVKPSICISVCEDPDDNKFLEAALEGRADFVVSQDMHLLKLKSYLNIKILSPEQFLKILQ